MRISRKILKTQYTDEFGGYSKTWFNDGLQEAIQGTQDNFIEEEDSDNGENGMDGLARSLGLNIEKIAIKLAMKGDMPPI